MSQLSIEVKRAIKEVKDLVLHEGNLQDIQYFDYHEPRFEYMANAVSKLIKPGSEILEMGSHYLHSSLILTKLGYKVNAMDVEVFWQIPLVTQRSIDNNIKRIVENNLETLRSQDGVAEKYDLILFTEILEHITFNPINFWKKIYACSKSNAKIYISTPNSFALPTLLRAMKNMFIFKSMGLGVDQIFSNVTYGHHWKEYSSREIRKYFSKLSDDFEVSTKKYHCKKMDKSTTANLIWSYLIKLGNYTYFLSSDIEAIVSINKSDKPWKLNIPEY